MFQHPSDTLINHRSWTEKEDSHDKTIRNINIFWNIIILDICTGRSQSDNY